ncbi:MAG: cytochrome P450 [Planctomycetia bacterium]|nr:cytochrome P450 [Planctomycetia bacterium]
MPATTWFARVVEQARGTNPFAGDVVPSRVPILAAGRPSWPFPHPWNYREPLRILDAIWWGAEREPGAGRHNRYLYAAGFPPVLVTRDPGVIRAVLGATGEKPGQFDRDTAPTAGIARATGEDSLLYANGEVWHRQKRLVAEPFSRANLFQPELFHEFEQTFRATVHERLELLRARQRASGARVTRLALEPEIKVLMLEMLVNNFFGGGVGPEELRGRFVPALETLIDHMVSDTIAPRLRALADRLTGRAGRNRRLKADFEALVDVALAGRAKGLGLWKQFRSEAPDDALRANIRVFLAGAMEATTSFASWAISHLARAPHIQERIHAEVRNMTTYDPDTLAVAPTLNRALEETLRLTPALYFLPRRAAVDTTIETADHRKLLVPKGTHVVLDVWNSNRCDEFWGVDATGSPAADFAPERWEFLAAKGVTPKDKLHFGFGFGPRFCPGRNLGLLEVGLVVGAAVKLFRFSAAGGRTEARAGVSTKPADGVLVDLELRD